ncbi:MAG: hypothetical protein A2915_03100 [Candidatus Yanofskybacteria bacterium RIFCSPLOWO2_01_FULL_41_34]|uniref:DUF115 domain-containing protein n=1 Tax=Candidatus Yanofskybacteria bacterium RIFCSPHIGHO2_01_FULL_41_26 TaxID=1802661 RepID=A0A1F8EDH4_9BACT|nr:MAG: hypothetical protein A2649_00995 [Candidatus Yanofskybacteria bacterium RIFCSPHIGHO2_01_FULL_41_26]OGN21022.1 MAG: hypothetical protein A2915_03100 [Candidatus Yanofskybacteria bacterium RIFCSPLOWO2_01_FULL_41_34]
MISNLADKLACYMSEATAIKTGRLGLDNAAKNRKYFSKTVDDLSVIEHLEPKGAAIVVVGGPSLHRKNPVAKILASGFSGDIIVADGSLGHCLRKGLIPHFVITLDPGAFGRSHRMVRLFGDTKMDKGLEDDYFLRQDLDPGHHQDQIRYNRETIELVNRYGPKIKLIISTSVDISVTERCVESGMELYWWNPIYEDYDKSESLSRELFENNHIPCMLTGGNVGTAAWIFAHAILKRKHVALVGMDLSYAPGTPLLNTQYYRDLVALFGDRTPEAFTQVYNPYLNETWYTDPAYLWYRNIFLDLAKDAGCITYNCTEGGILFDELVHFVPLTEFLSKFSQRNNQELVGSRVGERE